MPEEILEQRPVGQTGQRVMAGLMAHLGLGPLKLSDVQRDGDDFGNASGVVEQRRFAGQQSSLLVAAGSDHLMLEARQGFAALEHLGVQHQMLGGVVLAVDFGQGLAGRGGGIDPVQLLMGAVDQGEPSADVHRADHGRHGVDQSTQPKLACPQRRLMLLRAGQQLAPELVGPLLQQLLLLAHGEQVAGAGSELVVIDRAQQEVGRPGLERLVAVAALLVDGDHHDRNLGSSRHRAKRPGEVRSVHARHLEVGDHQVRHRDLHPLERRLRAGKRLDPHALLDGGGQPRQNVTVGDTIVDDNDIWHKCEFSTIV